MSSVWRRSAVSSFKRVLHWKPDLNPDLPLTVFFHRDEALRCVVDELDSFDGLQSPSRCEVLIDKLRCAQSDLLSTLEDIYAHVNDQRISREFRRKFPDDIRDDLGDLFPPLWFGAECLAGGSLIEGRSEEEVHNLRPIAMNLCQAMDRLRESLRTQAVRDASAYPPNVRQRLLELDEAWTKFEARYITCVVPVKSEAQYAQQQDTVALFAHGLCCAVHDGFIEIERVDQCDPALMFTIPRLGLVSGLLGDCPALIVGDSDDDCQLPYIFLSQRSSLKELQLLLQALSEFCLQELKHLICNTNEGLLNIKSISCGGEGAVMSSSLTITKNSTLVESSKEDEYALSRCRMSSLELNDHDRRHSVELVQLLFRSVAAIADALQSGEFAKDMREILKIVFQTTTRAFNEERYAGGNESIECVSNTSDNIGLLTSHESATSPPVWVPDKECSSCYCCHESFSLVKRKHHCRHCGQIFCSRCSDHSVPLPILNLPKPQRVCSRCYALFVGPKPIF